MRSSATPFCLRPDQGRLAAITVTILARPLDRHGEVVKQARSPLRALVPRCSGKRKPLQEGGLFSVFAKHCVP